MNCRIALFALSCVGFALMVVLPTQAGAQTDYYNTDKGRPLQTEDASPVDRRAFEIQAAPLRLERSSDGVYHWSVEPEVVFGVLPRTQIELGLPLSFVDAGRVRRSGLSGLDLSALYNLNVETTIPALAISAGALLPIGALRADDPYFTLKGIATRTLSWARLHANVEYTTGKTPAASTASQTDVTRWSAGIAIDRTWPLQSFLVGGELVIQQPINSTEDPVLIVGTGARYQLAPRWAIDAGLGKRFTGDDRSWYVTIGSAFAFGLPWYPRGGR